MQKAKHLKWNNHFGTWKGKTQWKKHIIIKNHNQTDHNVSNVGWKQRTNYGNLSSTRFSEACLHLKRQAKTWPYTQSPSWLPNHLSLKFGTTTGTYYFRWRYTEPSSWHFFIQSRWWSSNFQVRGKPFANLVQLLWNSIVSESSKGEETSQQ
jgi:hypothetical protein